MTGTRFTDVCEFKVNVRITCGSVRYLQTALNNRGERLDE